jgi:hypothetical protein
MEAKRAEGGRGIQALLDYTCPDLHEFTLHTFSYQIYITSMDLLIEPTNIF